jgi:alpha-beta hydrolase superfamily lysophospholipase
MTPEQETLENVLATTFREVSTAARLADMAGLDVVQVDRRGCGRSVRSGCAGSLPQP